MALKLNNDNQQTVLLEKAVERWKAYFTIAMTKMKLMFFF